MKNLIFIAILVLVTQGLLANNWPELNLEIGKTYTIETVDHIDSSSFIPQRFWNLMRWEITPVQYKPENKSYEMKALLHFYQHVEQENVSQLGWQEKNVFETSYLQSCRNPIIYLNQNQIPVYFEISREGTILSYNFSEYEKSKTPEGYQLVLDDNYRFSIESQLQTLFFYFHDGEKTHMDKMREYTSGYYLPCYNDFEKVKEDDQIITFDFHPKRLDVSRLFEQEIIQEQISIEKSSGLILRKLKHYHINNIHCILKKSAMCNDSSKIKAIRELNLNQNPTQYLYSQYKDNGTREAIFHQRTYYTQENIKKLKYFHRGICRDTMFTSVNTILQGEILHPIAGNDSLIISLDNQTFFLIRLDDQNHFQLGLQLEKRANLQIFYPLYNWNKTNHFQEDLPQSNFSFSLAPGDQPEIILDAIENLQLKSVTGLGSNEIQCFYESSVLQAKADSASPEETTSSRQKVSDISYRNYYSTALSIAVQNRAKIDPLLYMDMINSLIYTNRAIADSSKLINNTLAKNNRAYLNFLRIFIRDRLKNQISQITGVTSFNSNVQTENGYYLGQIALAEPVKSHYLADYVTKAIHSESWEIADQLYQSFKRNFSHTPIFPDVEKEYLRFSVLVPGKRAPDFSLRDTDGNIRHLSDFKGKVVVLQFYIIDGQIRSDSLTYTGLLSSAFEKTDTQFGNEVVYLNVLQRNNPDLIDRIKKNKYPGIYLIDPLPNSVMIYKYLQTSSYGAFIIDRNGRIYKRNEGHRNSVVDQDILNALAIPYQKSYSTIPIWLRMTLITLIGTLILIVLSFLIYTNVTRQKLKKSKLNNRLRELELTAIRAQMNPHFLYNCLNSIQNLVQKGENEKAHLYLSKFAMLIRHVLNTSKKEEISLDEELKTIGEYIDLEKLRFEFDYEINIDPGIDPISLFLPPMLLQPIIENALIHGLLPKADNRKLALAVQKENNHICITINDNGIGLQASAARSSPGLSKGLELTRERLRIMGERHHTVYALKTEDLKDKNDNHNGTSVQIIFEDE